VHAHEVAVARQPDIALEAVGTLVEGAHVGAERVFRQRVGAASVGEDQGAVVVHSTWAG
jgi:hypothetical protein